MSVRREVAGWCHGLRRGVWERAGKTASHSANAVVARAPRTCLASKQTRRSAFALRPSLCARSPPPTTATHGHPALQSARTNAAASQATRLSSRIRPFASRFPLHRQRLTASEATSGLSQQIRTVMSDSDASMFDDAGSAFSEPVVGPGVPTPSD